MTTVPEFLPEMKRHLAMYAIRKTYLETCALIVGLEGGSGHSVMRGFHGWLLARGNGRPELYWTHLVLCEIYGDRNWPDLGTFTPEQDEQAVALLLGLMEEYFAAARS